MTDHRDHPPAAGWYDDPDGRKGIERYWNGTEWSGAPRNKPPELNWSGIATIIIGTVVLSVVAWWLFLN